MVGGEMGNMLAGDILVKKFKKKRRGMTGVSVLIRELGDGPYSYVHITEDNYRNYIPAAIEYGHVLAPWGHSPRSFFNISAKSYKKMSKKYKTSLYGMRFVAPIPFMRNASDSTTSARFRFFESLVNKYIIDLWTSKVVKSKPVGYFDDDE
jgi:hypothetical protein